MMSDAVKWSLQAIVVVALGAMLASTCTEEPHANCYTCVARCAPFAVGACEPSWSHVRPLYCSCNVFSQAAPSEPDAARKK